MKPESAPSRRLAAAARIVAGDGRLPAVAGEMPVSDWGRVATGHAEIDAALGGGLAIGRVHECFAADPADSTSAAGFAGMVACRHARGVVWLREQRAEHQGGALHPPGLLEIGFDPARLILAVLPDPVALLRAAVDVMRCSDVGLAVVELWGEPRTLDLTASRRLALAAERSGVTALMLRIGAQPAPSAAQTRWQVRACASQALEADAPGHPAIELELSRQRGRAETGCWHVEWDREHTVFRSIDAPAIGDRSGKSGGTPLPGTVVPLAADRPADPRPRVALRRAG